LTLFALKMMRHRTDTIDADLSVFGFAVPQPPVQTFDFLDNHRLRCHSCRIIGRQTAGCLLQVLQPHGDVKPVEHRRFGDTGISQNAPQAGASVGERGQRRILGSPDGVEAAADQHVDVGVTLATAPKTCRLPDPVSTLPTRTSKCRSPSSQMRMIFKTSEHCFSPLGPVFTNLTIQATHLPPIRDQTRNYRFGARPPISRQSRTACGQCVADAVDRPRQYQRRRNRDRGEDGRHSAPQRTCHDA
jgi:hypothetical protein